MKRDKVIVLAGNYREFEEYLDSAGLTTEHAIYGDAHHMAGTEAQQYQIIGTFWDRHDAADARAFAKTRIRPTY